MKKALLIIFAFFVILIVMKGGKREKKDPIAELQTKPMTMCKYVLNAAKERNAEKIKVLCDDKTKELVQANLEFIATLEKGKQYKFDTVGPILKMQNAKKTKAYNSFGSDSTGGSVCDFEIHMVLKEDGKWYVTRFSVSG